MVAHEAPRSPPPGDQVETHTTRDLPPQPIPSKRGSSASDLSKEMATAFKSSADDLDIQNDQSIADEATVRYRPIIVSNRSFSDSKEPMRSSPDSIKQRKEHSETVETGRRRGNTPTREAPPTTEPDLIATALRPAAAGLVQVIDTKKANRTAIPVGKKTPRSARYETFRSPSKPRHPRLQHERHSAEDSDTSSVDMYHKAAEELARDQKTAGQLAKLARFSYGAYTLGSHHEDSDSDNDVWHRSGNFLSPPPPRSVSSSVREQQRPSRGSDDSSHHLDLSDSKQDRSSRRISVHTFGGRGQNGGRTPSPSASSRLSEQPPPPRSPFSALRRPRPTSELLKTTTASTVNESTSGISSELLLAGDNRDSSSSSPRSLNRHSSILSKVVFNKRVSVSTPIAPTNIPPTPASTPISPSFNDMPLLNPYQAQQVHASLPPMNPPPILSESSSSSSLGGLSLAALAQKTKAITSAGFKTSEERRRAKLKSKIRVFGDGGTVLGISEKGVEVVGVRKPEPETEQRRGAYNYMSIPGGPGSSGSSESLGGTVTPTGSTVTGTGGMVFGREITDSTGPEMWTGGRFGARAGIGKGLGQGLVRPFVVPAAGQMENRGKSPARPQQYGQGLGGVGGHTVLSPPPQPPPSRALPNRPGQQARVQENAGARYGNARLGQVMKFSKSEGRGNGGRGGTGGALVDARGNVMFPAPGQLDGVRPVL
ncbi:hypothetical protein QBC44DRAFT_311067 [Cladorrhinum sp. PSN332]|nr:hypothetical protein QBC44DRAFT_311067 [Cladorrhinum sp. PSN332]